MHAIIISVFLNQLLQITLGGMVFDRELNRGVRKKYVSEPNPQKVELQRDSTLPAVLEKAKELYFKDMHPQLDALSLCDSSGVLIPVQDDIAWTLGAFYNNNLLQPSRYKLYVALIRVRVT